MNYFYSFHVPIFSQLELLDTIFLVGGGGAEGWGVARAPLAKIPLNPLLNGSVTFFNLFTSRLKIRAFYASFNNLPREKMGMVALLTLLEAVFVASGVIEIFCRLK